jgi:hypothetical protein
MRSAFSFKNRSKERERKIGVVISGVNFTKLCFPNATNVRQKYCRSISPQHSVTLNQSKIMVKSAKICFPFAPFSSRAPKKSPPRASQSVSEKNSGKNVSEIQPRVNPIKRCFYFLSIFHEKL